MLLFDDFKWMITNLQFEHLIFEPLHNRGRVSGLNLFEYFCNENICAES